MTHRGVQEPKARSTTIVSQCWPLKREITKVVGKPWEPTTASSKANPTYQLALFRHIWHFYNTAFSAFFRRICRCIHIMSEVIGWNLSPWRSNGHSLPLWLAGTFFFINIFSRHLAPIIFLLKVCPKTREADSEVVIVLASGLLLYTGIEPSFLSVQIPVYSSKLNHT